ncbi:C40 family peptidase [Actinomadura litoris]|uniref:NlpC/P60 domain-containing protein n=1 Tax=Actinomadura litoris TaxID=2678616 RepID=A0A7K1KSX4_9ACTN|nr:C40 family peptidase [Actinomadura litoris]MUN35253.1 hypothetical protein [Actinomadura litoris]
MKGKHGSNWTVRNLNPRVAGAVAGVAALGVIGGIVQVTTGSSGSDPADSVAAIQTVPQAPNQTDRSPAGTPEARERKADKREADKRERDTRDRASRERRTEKKTPEPVAGPRSEVIERAKTWNPGTSDRVSYSQTDYHNGYRTDCSGFVSMALGLPKPGENTVGLTSSRLTERISMSELKKGDLVMDALGTNTTRHVVIFEKWANSDHTAYWAYEQRGRYGTDHRTRDYGLSSGSEYKAYRPTNL